METALEKKWEVYALKYAERSDRTRKESFIFDDHSNEAHTICLLYTSPSPRD